MMSESPNEIGRRNAEAFRRCGVPTLRAMDGRDDFHVVRLTHPWSEYARRDDLKRFYNLKALQEVCLQTPKEPP